MPGCTQLRPSRASQCLSVSTTRLHQRCSHAVTCRLTAAARRTERATSQRMANKPMRPTMAPLLVLGRRSHYMEEAASFEAALANTEHNNRHVLTSVDATPMSFRSARSNTAQRATHKPKDSCQTGRPYKPLARCKRNFQAATWDVLVAAHGSATPPPSFGFL